MFEKDPRTFSPDYKNLSPEQKAMVRLEVSLSRFFKDFDKSIRRWEQMIYPAAFIFGMLGLSGFYLIYNVTSDMATVARKVDPRMEVNMDAMSRNMAQLTESIATMTEQVTSLTASVQRMEASVGRMDQNVGTMAATLGNVEGDIETMTITLTTLDQSVGEMSKSMKTVTVSVQAIDQSARALTATTGNMSNDMRRMNEHVRPMGFMNNFLPW